MPRALRTPNRPLDPAATAGIRDLARCLDCGSGLAGRDACPGCGRAYPEVDGILEAIGPLTGHEPDRRGVLRRPGLAPVPPLGAGLPLAPGPGVAAARAAGPPAPVPARRAPGSSRSASATGRTSPLLPSGWTVYGVDIARSPARACLRPVPRRWPGRLAWAEAEALAVRRRGRSTPCFTVGGFNYFRDHARGPPRDATGHAARRAASSSPTSTPTSIRFAPRPPHRARTLSTRWCAAADWASTAEFVAMVARATPLDVEPSPRAAWSGRGHRRLPIWNRLGYCLVELDESGHDRARVRTMSTDDRPAGATWTRLDAWRCSAAAAAAATARRGRGSGLACAACGAGSTRSATASSSSRTSRPTTTGSPSDFYNSPLWPKFRFWEKFTWVCNGGERRARDAILRHLPQTARASSCSTWRSATASISTGSRPTGGSSGVDVSTVAARRLPPRAAGGRDLRLIQGEAEALPFRDRQFDAVLSIGGVQLLQRPRGGASARWSASPGRARRSSSPTSCPT